MTRVTDEQIADMKALGGERARLLERKLERAIHHLEAERTRADVLEFSPDGKWHNRAKWLIWVLMRSRREWMDRALESKCCEDMHQIMWREDMKLLNKTILELAEARAWAAWFAAKADWRADIAMQDLGRSCELREDAEVRLSKVREMHKRVSHSALYPNDCGRCGVEWPCETVRILDGGAA
jgi:hypothetical protein